MPQKIYTLDDIILKQGNVYVPVFNLTGVGSDQFGAAFINNNQRGGYIHWDRTELSGTGTWILRLQAHFITSDLWRNMFSSGSKTGTGVSTFAIWPAAIVAASNITSVGKVLWPINWRITLDNTGGGSWDHVVDVELFSW